MFWQSYIGQRIKFFSTGFFCKCEKSRRYLQVCLYLVWKSCRLKILNAQGTVTQAPFPTNTIPVLKKLVKLFKKSAFSNISSQLWFQLGSMFLQNFDCLRLSKRNGIIYIRRMLKGWSDAILLVQNDPQCVKWYWEWWWNHLEYCFNFAFSLDFMLAVYD